MTHHWCLLTNGAAINLDNIEAVVPDPEHEGEFQFYPPRTQRGGRPVSRPTKRPAAYVEHEGYWHGVPVDGEGLLEYLRGGPPGPAREA